MSLYTKKTIKLEKLSFFGYHGVNDYEKIDGQNFKVDLEISFHLNTFDDDINKSIDYIDLYNCIKRQPDWTNDDWTSGFRGSNTILPTHSRWKEQVIKMYKCMKNNP